MDLSTSSVAGNEHSLSLADFGGLHLSSFMPHVAPDPSRSPPPSLRIAMRIPEGTRVHSNVPFSVSNDAVPERDSNGAASLSVLNPTPLPPRAVAWMPPPLSPLPFSPIHSPMPAAAAPARATLREPSPDVLSSSSSSSSSSSPALSGPSTASALDAAARSSSSGSLQPLPLLSSSASLPSTAASPAPLVDALPAVAASTDNNSAPMPAPAVPSASAALSSSTSAPPLRDSDSSLVDVLSRLEQSQAEFDVALQAQTQRRLREEARTDEGRELQATQRLEAQHSAESRSNILRAQASARIAERPWVAALRGEDIFVHHYGVNPADGQPIYPSTVVESEEQARRARSEAREQEAKRVANSSFYGVPSTPTTTATASAASASGASTSAALSGSGRGLNALFVPSFVRQPAAPSNPRTLTVLERFGALDPSASAATAAAPPTSSFTSAPSAMPLSSVASVSSSWPRGALSSSSSHAAPASAADPYGFSSSNASFVPAAFASPSPSQEVADLFRLSHQRRDRAAPRSRIIDEEVGLRVGGGGVVRSADAAEAPVSGLHELWGRQGAAKLAASLKQIAELPSLAQVVANPVAVAAQQQQQHQSQPQPSIQSLPASVSTALSLATGSVIPTSTPEMERQYETLKREYALELRARKQVEEEAVLAAQRREQEWRQTEEEEYQKVLQRTREERGITQPVHTTQQQQPQHQPQQQSQSDEPPVRQQPPSAARSASASPVPSVRSLRPALSRAASTTTSNDLQPLQQPPTLHSPHVAFSDSTAASPVAGADPTSLGSIESHLEQLQCSTKEAASTPVTVFVQQALDAIESKLAAPSSTHDPQGRQRVAKELHELANLLASTTATATAQSRPLKASPVGSSRSLPVSRRSSLHPSHAAGTCAVGTAASSRALSSRALSSAAPSMRSSLQSSAQSSRAPSVHGGEEHDQAQQQAQADSQPTQQLKPKAREAQPQQLQQQQPIARQPQQAPLQTVSEASFSSRSSLHAGSSSSVHHLDATSSSRSSFAPPTHARLASVASSRGGASILGESQLVHPPHSRQSSFAHASAIDEMMDRTLPLDADRGQEAELPEEDQRSEHAAGSEHPSEHLSVSRAPSEHSSHAPSTVRKAPPQPRVRAAAATGRLPLTAREVRALVRSEVLGSAAELRANYSYLPPPPRPITLTRTQMLQQAAREAAARRAQEQSAHATQCRMARRAAPIAAAVRKNVEAMLEQQMMLRGAQWDPEQPQQDANLEGPARQQPQREEESKEESQQPQPHRSPAQRAAAAAAVEEMLRDPPRILQPTFSPPATKRSQSGTSRSPVRNYESAAALRSSPPRSAQPKPASVMLSAVPQDYDVQAHLAGLFNTAQRQLQSDHQPPREASAQNSRHGSISDLASAAAVGPSPTLSALAVESSSFVSSVASSTSGVEEQEWDAEADEADEEEEEENRAVRSIERAKQVNTIMQQLASTPMLFSNAAADPEASHMELRPVAVVMSPADRR